VLAISVVVLVWGRETRKLGAYLLLSVIAAVGLIVWMHSHMGMVRLLGIAHVILWSPLVYWLYLRLRDTSPPRFYKIVMKVLFATLVVTLAFDYLDVIRWVLGERAPYV